MIETARVGMPLLVPGQNGKEVIHNEALLVADALLCPVVEAGPTASPPGSPLIGQCFPVASGASGAWVGHDGYIAAWTEGGWRLIDVPEGAAFRVRASGLELVRTASGWETGIMRADEVRVGGNAVVRGQQAAIASVSGGSVVDAQSRSTIGLILSALRAHGLIAT